MSPAPRDPLARLRTICLDLPEAEERETWGEATFRVREKIYVIASTDEAGRVQFSCKAVAGLQGMLVAEDPQRFFIPPYVGRFGWIGVRLDAGTPWDRVADLVEESYRMTAPKRLVRALDRS